MCHELLDNHFLLVLDVDAGGIRGFDAAALQVDEVVGWRIVDEDIVDTRTAGRYFNLCLDVLRLIPAHVIGGDHAEAVLRARFAGEGSLIVLGDSCHQLCLTAVLEGEDVVGADAGSGIRTAQGHYEFTVFLLHLCNRRRRIVGVEGIHVGIGDDGPSEWLSKQ